MHCLTLLIRYMQQANRIPEEKNIVIVVVERNQNMVIVTKLLLRQHVNFVASIIHMIDPNVQLLAKLVLIAVNRDILQ